MTKLFDSIIDVPGIRVGNSQNLQALTGCTVVLCEKGAVGGIDQRGGAPGTRETDLLRPVHLVQEVHAIVLAGGSAFGLDAASGVMQFLSDNNVGFNSGPVKVPIVPAAVIFDLGIGNSDIYPDAEMGYQACHNASTHPFEQGNIGAGTGATVGKLFGMTGATKSGLGTASIEVSRGVIVGTLVVVNAFGDIYDETSHNIIAGLRPINIKGINIGGDQKFANTLTQMKSLSGKSILKFAGHQNTVIGVIATNARLSKEESNKVAQMAQNGIARSIRPAHTMFDGDTIFCLSTGNRTSDVNIIGAYACEAMVRAIINATIHSQSAGGVPSASELDVK